ncbi:MAG: hypothetical protein F9K34_09705 [Albidovulum sp.]|uniref:YiiX/YebB-like N1pC/P60 family cysteine hydrolase n=1 Tax=Albidovulum sp. TaxID=1872424 RepID=UPI001323E0E5|nr:YiiX/YebB-like N1pC/P60 family cysteine hydrolase [Defluviimonas sp.]KAB2884132.1 MAG: hypothetical protein F9K34_09705 [Defluviimonas sp.]
MEKATKSDIDNSDCDIDLIEIDEELSLSISNLLPGDVLLFRSLRGDKLAKKIAQATNSPYTHAALYLGDGEIVESNPPNIQVRQLTKSDCAATQIGVLRSQMTFQNSRVAAVTEFVNRLISTKARYDYQGVVKFKGRNADFHENIISEIQKNYGVSANNDDAARKNYFCSALVVACYTASGIIGVTAEVLYPPNIFSPGDLHRDPTFGWFLGYLYPKNSEVPSDDPLLDCTLWRDNSEARWW